MRDVLSDLGRLPLGAARLLAAHWPTLVTVCMLGLAARQGVLWLAFVASDVWSPAGVLLLPLGALCMMAALAVMLRTLRPSMQNLADEQVPPLTTLILPLLLVYAAQGLLAEDFLVLRYDTVWAEFTTVFVGANYKRFVLAEGWTLVVIVVGALGLRLLIERLGWASRSRLMAVLAAYLEALWLAQLAGAGMRMIASLGYWLSTRRVLAWWPGFVSELTAISGPLGTLARVSVQLVSAIAPSVAALVVIPAAWLTAGALVYGLKLVDDWVPTEGVTGWRAGIRKLFALATAPLRSAVQALRKVADTGIEHLTMFGVMFALVGLLPSAVAALTWLVAGPQEGLIAMVVTPYHLVAQRIVYFVVVVALLGAAANHIAGHGSGKRDPEVVGIKADA